MSVARRIWRTAWRLTVCGLLLAWIFHSIFVNEARQIAGAEAFARLPRMEQWRQGWSIGPLELFHTLTAVKPGHFVLSVIVLGLALAAAVARWRLALAVQGLDLSWGRAIEISAVAHFFNSFLLGSTGGDVMKAWYAARETRHKKTEAVLTVAVDRLIGLWAMLLFACIMMLFNVRYLKSQGWLQLISAAVILMMVTGTGVMVVAFWGGVSRRWTGARTWLRRLPKGEWLESVLNSCRRFGQARGFVPRALLLSMLLNLLCVGQFYILSRGMGLSISVVLLSAVVPIVICISALPITPSGLGVRENLFVQMVALVGVEPTAALSLSLLAFAGSLIWSVVGGIVYATLKEKHQLTESDLQAEPGREAGA